MEIDTKRLISAASFVHNGLSLTVGDVVLSSEDDETLCITGWSYAISMETVSRQSALAELGEIKRFFQNMLGQCPNLLTIAGKRRVKFRLCLDYGMGGLDICSEIEETLIWSI